MASGTFDFSPQRQLLARLMARAELPKRVFHYTTSEGFLGILEGRCIRATDIRYLNDSQEYDYTLALLSAVLSDRKTRLTTDEATVFARFERALGVAPNMRIYVSCFSRFGDTLSQWRAYARSGFSVSFDPQLLLAAAVDYPEPTAFLGCVYNRQEQEGLINSAVDFLLREYQTELAAGKQLETILDAYEVHFFAHVVILASCFKHPKFEEESEWRLIVQPHDIENGSVGRKVRTGNRWLVPYRNLPLAAANGTLEIREVIVGPTPHMDLACEATRIVLDEQSVRYNAVVGSEMPYRDW